MPKTINLRKMEQDDILLFIEWLKLSHVAAWYHEPEDWIYEVKNQAIEYPWLYHYIAEEQGRPIGFCQYYEYANSGEDWHGSIPLEGTYSIDYLIGDVNYLGKGYGAKMLQLLLDKIRQGPKAKRIIVQPEELNAASCGVLRSIGFHFDEENKVFILAI